MSDPSFEQNEITAVEYGETDGMGRVLAWHLIRLLPDGSLDFGSVPKKLVSTWQSMGIAPPMSASVFPSDGKNFLRVLLQRSSAYLMIRVAKNNQSV